MIHAEIGVLKSDLSSTNLKVLESIPGAAFTETNGHAGSRETGISRMHALVIVQLRMEQAVPINSPSIAISGARFKHELLAVARI
jgi:hypothetical protein